MLQKYVNVHVISEANEDQACGSRVLEHDPERSRCNVFKNKYVTKPGGLRFRLLEHDWSSIASCGVEAILVANSRATWSLTDRASDEAGRAHARSCRHSLQGLGNKW